MQERVSPQGETAATSAEILATLVGYDTTSRNSNLPLIEWVESYLQEHGVASERVLDETGTKANLFASIGGSREEGGFIVSGHTDTVPVDGQEWTSDPFTLTEREGKLYGRGTCDMKGFLACVLSKVPTMCAASLSRPLHLAFSYDEEVGCVGVRRLIAALDPQAGRFEACFVGEPSQMGVVTAHKTKRSMRVDFRGRSCHSSLAPRGVNAVFYASRLVARMEAIADELAEGPSDPLYDVAFSTAHVGVFNGGTALNIVPDAASVELEFRVLPTEDADALAAEIEAFVAELDAQMTAREAGCGATLTHLSSIPGLDTAPDAPVTQLAMRLAQRNDHAKVAYGTEAGRFNDDLRVPTIVVGPGSIDQAHRPDEFVEIAQLEACERFLDALIAHASTPR